MVGPVLFAPEYVEQLRQKQTDIRLMCEHLSLFLESLPMSEMQKDQSRSFCSSLSRVLCADIEGVLRLADEQSKPPDTAQIQRLDAARAERAKLEIFQKAVNESVGSLPEPLQGMASIGLTSLADKLASLDGEIKKLEATIDTKTGERNPCD